MNYGLLTYHYVCNEGALWQAYSLVNAFREIAPELGVEILNYQMPAKAEWNKATFSARKTTSFESFRRSFIDSSPVKETDLQNFSGLIVGSDIIWQFSGQVPLAQRFDRALKTYPFGKGEGQAHFLNKLRGIKHCSARIIHATFSAPPAWSIPPNPYWLPWVSDQKKVSFAASMGYSRPQLLKKEERQLIHGLLDDFALISVRDSHTKTFVEELIGREVEKIADPAWLYDEPLVDVKGRLESLGWDGKAPLAGILYPRGNRYGQGLETWVLDELRDQGFMTVSVIDANHDADIDLASQQQTPFDWWSVIESLDFLLTVRTHPNIAALKYHTPFLNLDITSAINSADVSKSADMLAEFGLDDLCLFRDAELNKRHIKQRLRVALNKTWDWASVDNRIALHNDKSAGFIRRTAALFNG